MSPTERLRQITDTTRVSLPVTVLVAMLGTAGGAVAAGYAAKEQLLSRVNVVVKEQAQAERRESDAKYLTRDEFAETVRIPLEGLKAEVKQIGLRLEARR